MNKEIILIKNGELALKGLNRSTFEEVMIKNIKRHLKPLGNFSVKRAQSTIAIEPIDDDFDMSIALEKMKYIFGVAAFSKAFV